MSALLKQKLKVIFTLAVLILTIVCFLVSNGTLAWFAKNENVNANGFSVSAKNSPNIVIAKTAEEILQGDIAFSVDFKGMTRSHMVPVTREENAPETFLKYLVNHHAVDFNTGNAKDDSVPLEFENVPTTDNEIYFVDRVVYIASTTQALPITSLKASIVKPFEVGIDHSYFNAASIDFYVEEVSQAGYRGTTSVSKTIKNQQDRYINLFPSGGEIPFNAEGCIKIIMRCYFDGALQDEQNNRAYINSYLVRADAISLGVEFVAEESGV
jgi:hypothetical protein